MSTKNTPNKGAGKADAEESNNMSDDYKTSYGNPPIEHQFKPGQSGNPKGRPKGTKNLKTDVRETLNAPLTLSENGKTKKVSTQKAALLRLREKALSGDARALDRLLGLAQTYNDEELREAASDTLGASDQAIVDAHIERLARRNQAALGMADHADSPEKAEDDQQTAEDGAPHQEKEVEDDDDWLK